MPAAAVIPAPIAYIKVVAVKKLVVGCQFRADGPSYRWFTDRPETYWLASPAMLLTGCGGWPACLL